MEMEAPARHGTVVAAATNPKKRSLDEVVPPVFVEDDGAYGIAEMPKRFVLGNQQQHDKYSGMMAAYHAMDVRITALNKTARRSAAALIQRLRAQDAARAAGDSQLALLRASYVFYRGKNAVEAWRRNDKGGNSRWLQLELLCLPRSSGCAINYGTGKIVWLCFTSAWHKEENGTYSMKPVAACVE